MTAKLGKVEIYGKGLPVIKSSDVLSTWSSDHVADKKRFNFHKTYSYQTWQRNGF